MIQNKSVIICKYAWLFCVDLFIYLDELTDKHI